MQKITPFLWFNSEAEEAVDFYVSLFKDSKIHNVTKYDEASAAVSGKPAGSVMTIDFEIAGQRFAAINGGPYFTFSGATSFVIDCANQEEVDHFWNAFSEGGSNQQCGWITDKYGVTWQVVPSILNELIQDKDPVKASRVTQAMLQMKKLDIAALKAAYDGV